MDDEPKLKRISMKKTTTTTTNKIETERNGDQLEDFYHFTARMHYESHFLNHKIRHNRINQQSKKKNHGSG